MLSTSKRLHHKTPGQNWPGVLYFWHEEMTD